MKNTVRQERIAKLVTKLSRIENALKNYRYTNPSDYLSDVVAFEQTEKEIEIQQAYWIYEA